MPAFAARLGAVLALAALPRLAFAAEPAPAAPPLVVVDSKTTESVFDRARAEDASIDRGLLNPHAETLGAGKFSINSYELFFLGLSYGITDDVQVSATTLVPVVKDMPNVLLVHAKYVLSRTERTAVALRGNVNYFSVEDATMAADGSVTEDVARAGTFGVGVAVDHRAGSVLSLHGSADVSGVAGKFGSNGLDVGKGALLSFQGGLTARLGDSVKLLGEFWLPAAVTSDEFEFAPFSFLTYGVRFFGRTVSADLAFMKFLSGENEDPFLLGLPVVTFNARF